jgi:hypothetical protein
MLFARRGSTQESESVTPFKKFNPSVATILRKAESKVSTGLLDELAERQWRPELFDPVLILLPLLSERTS